MQNIFSLISKVPLVYTVSTMLKFQSSKCLLRFIQPLICDPIKPNIIGYLLPLQNIIVSKY